MTTFACLICILFVRLLLFFIFLILIFSIVTIFHTKKKLYNHYFLSWYYSLALKLLKFSFELDLLAPDCPVHSFHVSYPLELLGDFRHAGDFIVVCELRVLLRHLLLALLWDVGVLHVLGNRPLVSIHTLVPRQLPPLPCKLPPSPSLFFPTNRLFLLLLLFREGIPR